MLVAQTLQCAVLNTAAAQKWLVVYTTSHKKFSGWKQAHVGMEASKTTQARWERHHNTFLTPSLHLVPFGTSAMLSGEVNSLTVHGSTR